MYLAGVSIRQLEYLAVVADLGSFGDAADELGVSQPALSQGLARLEGLIGAPLFEPDGRRRRLTPLGSDVAGYARRILGETKQLETELLARRDGTVGRLRVGMIDAAILYLLDGGVERFRLERTGVDLHLTVGDSGALLARLETFDLDLVYVVGPPEELVSAPIHEEPLFIYGPPLPADLRSATWVLYPNRSKTRRAIDHALASEGIEPRVVGESGNPRVLRQLVRLGMGWTVLPSDIAETGDNPLERRSAPIGTRTLHAVWRPGAEEDPLIHAFRSTVEHSAD